MDKETYTKIKEALEQWGGELDAQNATPSTAPLVAAAGIDANRDLLARKGLVSGKERSALRQGLKGVPTDVLYGMLSEQGRQKDAGIPFEAWASLGGRSIDAAMASDPFMTKTLDTSGASALIRQDLEPILYEIYIREFPAWERFQKEPSNGLVHAYNKQTSFGDAQFMTELGTVTDDVGTYTRATTPVSVIATRRGITLKSQYATIQGGAGFNPEQLEMRNGLRAIAHKMQKTIFQGNSTVSGAASVAPFDEDGVYDANAFDGLRRILNTASAVDVDPTSGTPEDIRAAISNAATTVMQAGGKLNAIFLDPIVKRQWDTQQDKNVRFTVVGGTSVGMTVNSVNTPFGELGLDVVPGDSIGEYTRSAVVRSDIFLLDMDTISLPYLGSDGVTVLDIPMGIGGQLTHQFIMFGMWGLAVKVPTFSNKVRVHRP